MNTRLALACLVSVLAVMIGPALMHWEVIPQSFGFLLSAVCGLLGGIAVMRAIARVRREEQERFRENLRLSLEHARRRAAETARAESKRRGGSRDAMLQAHI